MRKGINYKSIRDDRDTSSSAAPGVRVKSSSRATAWSPKREPRPLP